MSLRAIGKVADIKSQNRTFPSGDQYVETRVWVQTSRTKILELVVDKDFPTADYPKVDEDVDLEVAVRSFSTKSGAGLAMTATARRFETFKAAPLAAAK